MATGYTAAVQDGKITELNDFVLSCARAFGACIMQRDDDPNDPPKLQNKDSYYSNMLEQKKKDLVKFKKLSLEDFKKSETKKLEEHIEKAIKYQESEKIQKERYLAMLEKVQEWEPPTAEHSCLKDFMVSQLEDSIDFDCKGTYWEDQENISRNRLEKLTCDEEVQEMYDALLFHLEQGISYYENLAKEDEDRRTSRNQWIIDLNKSLGLEIS